ncbi:MAG: DEAD/DEAH box helicase [Planctomycetes bacterium]|nr:DEAD/DEAH box helicase [Planctomycetota bacterium]
MGRPSKKSRELTLKDKLSRLTYTQACKLLGENGPALIRQGGKYDIDTEQDVYLGGDLFRLNVDGAVATITLMADARKRLHYHCNSCQEVCEHVGAAFSLILEEKMTLGLAAPPRERIPIESLSDEELIQNALETRQERARTERMAVKSMDKTRLWTDYLVTNALSGKTYRVALRGWEAGDSYCACPDFRKNTLGTCKHILNVQRKVKQRFSSAVRCRGPIQKEFAVHLVYGTQLELALLYPEKLKPTEARAITPVKDRDIKNVRSLLEVIRQLTKLGREVTIYPDAEEYIEQALFNDHIRSKVAEIRKNPKTHPLRRDLLKTELLPYQLDGIAFAVGTGRSVLADDMGLGKTIQGIGVAELLAREARITKVLVICPTSIKSQWRSEIHRFSNRDCRIILGTAQERFEQYDNGSFFTICNYEQVLRDIMAIERTRWDLIILDEGQRIKNWQAKTSRIVKALRSRFALVLSGTPLENRLDDLFSVVEFVDDRRLGPSFRFFNTHRVVDEKGKVLGYKNLAQLRENLKPILLRRTRGTVMRQLPERTDEIVRIEPTAEQFDIDQSQRRIISSIVNKAYISEMDLLRLQKALLISRMAADSTFLVDKQAPGYSSKLERLDELLGELNAEDDRKIVLFSEWTTMLGLIEELLIKHDMKYVRLDGSVPQKKRAALVSTFRNDPDCKLFITTNAGSTGLNLQAANTVINVDLPWNPAVLEQRIARAHRMGQKRRVQVYILVTENTIEESMLGTLSAKQDLALAAVDFESTTDIVDLSSGIEDLKNRLEVLLGAQPDAPLDQSEKIRQEQQAQRLAQQEKIATAGGQLLNAAFSFLGELLPAPEQTPEFQEKQAAIQARLTDCLNTDDQGRPQLTFTLPDAGALQTLSQTLASLLGG